MDVEALVKTFYTVTMDKKLTELLESFVTDVDGVISQLNDHDLDMDGFSHEVGLLISAIIPEIKAVCAK